MELAEKEYQVDEAELDAEVEAANEELEAFAEPKGSFAETINCLPTMNDPDLKLGGLLEQRFWRYYRNPWGRNFFFEYSDPYNDLITICRGPRGGGKTTTGVTISIIDGMMRGIPVISNVPIAWVAKDAYGKLYKVESIPFDVEMFVRGNTIMKYKRLLLDEANYLADRLRSTSSKNLAMTDILQQARKFRMSVVFCTINDAWIDPRVTGSLCDIVITCNDLYYNHYYRRKYNLRKGERLTWDLTDQSGKLTGYQGSPMDGMTLNARAMWETFDTEGYQDPIAARKRLSIHEKTMIDDYGNEVKRSDWIDNLESKLRALATTGQTEWKAEDLWPSIPIEDERLRMIAGRYMKQRFGIEKTLSCGRAKYDLSSLCV